MNLSQIVRTSIPKDKSEKSQGFKNFQTHQVPFKNPQGLEIKQYGIKT